MKKAIRILAACLLMIGLAGSMSGQAVGRGTVTGRVTGSNGAPVAKAQVVVTSDVAPSYKQTVTCNDSGDFSVSGVPTGTIRASAVRANGVVRASVSANLSSNGSSVAVVIQIPAGK